MSTVILETFSNSSAPKLFGRWTDKDLTGYTVELKIEQPDNDVVTVPGTITAPLTGDFEFPVGATWPAGTFERGNSWAVMYFTNPSGGVEVYDNIYIKVNRGL